MKIYHNLLHHIDNFIANVLDVLAEGSVAVALDLAQLVLSPVVMAPGPFHARVVARLSRVRRA